jgi:phage-related protein (TIGR01555 family)
VSTENVQDSISNFVNGLGTEDDATQGGRPTLCGRLTDRELVALYVMDDLAARIVEGLPEAANQGGWRVLDKATKAIVDLPEEAPEIGEAQLEAAIWGRLYGGGAVFLLPDNPQQDLSKPREAAEPIKRLLTFDRLELTASRWQDDAFEEGFGEPSHYDVSPQRVSVGSAARQLRGVHRSWFLIYGGAKLPRELARSSDGFDDSVLQRVWASLRRFVQTEQAIANIVQRFETATFKIAGLAAAFGSPEGERLVTERMRLLARSQSIVNAALVDADGGESFERTFANVAGLDALWDRLAHSVAKAAGEPMTQLFGMAPGGLSSDDKIGKANYRKRVALYQDRYFKKNLQTFYKTYNEGRPVEIEFLPIDESTPEEDQLNNESLARMISVIVGAGVMSADEARDLLREKRLIQNDDPAPEQTPKEAREANAALAATSPTSGEAVQTARADK